VSEHRAPASEELLHRIASGDRDAFAVFYRRHRTDVYRFAFHMCGAHATAEDIVQDVFLVVIKQASRFQPERAAALPWLLGVARNHVRRNRAASWVRKLSTWIVAETSTAPDPLSDLTHREDVAAVRRLVAELPIRYREAVVLCDLRELSYADAAIVMRCAVGTVRSRLHRGRGLLAARLKKHEQLFRAPQTGIVL